MKGPVCAARGRKDAGDCRGRVQWHHPVSQQRLKREFPYGAWRVKLAGGWTEWRATPRNGVPLEFKDTPALTEVRTLQLILRDVRNRQWLCAFHHGQVEQRRLKFARAELAASVEEFAAEFGMVWSLDRDYGPRGDGDGF